MGELRNHNSYLILFPGTVLLVFFLVIPLVNNIIPTFLPQHGGVQNYTDFFQDSYNRGIFWRTLRVSSLVTVICLILGIPTAYVVATINKKWRSLLIALIIFPLLTNSVIRSFAWINILGKNGVINNLLLSLHIIDQPLSILYTEFAIIIGSVYLFLPTMILTLVGVMENIDRDMLEAAETLGARPIVSFLKIVIPLSLPGAIVGSTLVFTGTMTAYTTPQLLGGNQKMMMATFLYQRASTLGDWNGVAVIALVMILTTLIVMWLFNVIASKIDRREFPNA